MTAAVAALRWVLDARIAKLAIPERVGRATVIAAAVAVLAAIALSDPVERWEDFKEPPTGSELAGDGINQLRIGGSGRYQFWEQALDAFASDPIAGVGSAGYTPYWLEHRDIVIPATRAHSLVFETMAELGIIGLALILGFFGTAAVTGVRRARAGPEGDAAAAALGVLTVGFAASAVDWTWDLPAVFAATVVAAALLTGPATLAAGADAAPSGIGPARSRRRFGAGVSILIVGWISICAAGLLYLSDRGLRRAAPRSIAATSRRPRTPPTTPPRSSPGPPSRTHSLRWSTSAAGASPEAREEIEEAIDRAPRDYRLYLLATRLATEDSDPDAAAVFFGRAHELNPKDPTLADLIEGD